MLKPQFHPRLQRFLEDHFQLPKTADTVEAGTFSRSSTAADWARGAAWQAWCRVRPGLSSTGKEGVWLEFSLEDTSQIPPSKYPVQVAIVLLSIDRDARMAEWETGDLFVLPGLWGSGIGTRFAAHLLEDLKHDNIATCRVRLVTGRHLSSAGSRQEHLDNIAFYRSLGFTLDPDGERLHRSLP